MTKGKQFEQLINKANLNYAKQRRVCILKIPTPVELTKKGPIIRTSTVDFTGIIEGGKFIAFDAKDTKVKTRLDLKNIHAHQIQYLQTIRDLGGEAFFFIRFNSHWKDKAFITPLDFIEKWMFEESRKSIPFSEFSEEWLIEIDSYLEPFLAT